MSLFSCCLPSAYGSAKVFPERSESIQPQGSRVEGAPEDTAVRQPRACAGRRGCASPGIQVSQGSWCRGDLSQSQENIVSGNRERTSDPLNVNGEQPVQPSVEISPISPRSEQRSQLQQHMVQGSIFSEFDAIVKKKEEADTSVAQELSNLSRNRFRDILPYDSSRVILNRENNAEGSDYINASHVQMRVGSHLLRYIAAQAPLSRTVIDFWQMIWESNVQVIAMVTNERENGKEKCHRYWPNENSKKNVEHYGQYRVELKSIDKQDWCTTRQLTVFHIPSNSNRHIVQLQFVGWPDHRAPERPRVFLDYMDVIQSSRHLLSQRREVIDCEAPVLVHCSAGVGRTGVTILMDVLMTALEENQAVDVALTLSELREQRAYLVQTPGQYKFIYEALIEYLDNKQSPHRIPSQHQPCLTHV